jgi:hypothetical protein
MDYESVMSYGQCIFNICGTVENTDCDCDDSSCTRYPFIDGCDPSVESCCDRATITCCSEDPVSCRVLEIKDEGDRALYQTDMGQRSYLSEMDALVMSWLYPQPNWRFMELNYSPSDETGTFHEPYVSVQSMLDLAPQNVVILAHPATYPRPTSVMSKPMVIKPARGTVLIR